MNENINTTATTENETEKKCLTCKKCVWYLGDPKRTIDGRRYLVHCKGPWTVSLKESQRTVIIPNIQTSKTCKWFKEIKEKNTKTKVIKPGATEPTWM